MTMVIDCHGHYTVLPKAHDDWREAQKAAFKAGEAPPPYPEISDAEIRETIEANQLRLVKQRGADMTIFSPRASAMAPHVGDGAVAKEWAMRCNDLIARVVGLYPESFVGVCMLPQSPGSDMTNSIAELERCIDMGFIGCNLNPDPGGGHFKHPPLTDRYWYPFYEKMVELDVPAMIHVSGSCNPAMHATGAYYIAADTIAFMQLLEGDLFRDFPNLRFIIPHGGGAVPYHWGRYRGLADMLKKPDLATHLMNNIFFDTCVYHQPGIDLLIGVIDNKNILFGSEMVGAVRGVDPTTGHYFDDTKRYIDALDIPDKERDAIFEANARRVFPRLDALLSRRQGQGHDRKLERHMGAAEQILRAIDELERLEAALKSTSERRDPHWKRDYVRLRSDLQNHIVALGELGDQLTGPDMIVKEDLKTAYSRMRTAAAMHQGTWPVVRIDRTDPDYLRSLDEMRAIIAHYRGVARRLARDA